MNDYLPKSDGGLKTFVPILFGTTLDIGTPRSPCFWPSNSTACFLVAEVILPEKGCARPSVWAY